MRRKAKKLFKTPKGILILILAAWIAIAAPGQGVRNVLPGLGAALFAACAVDLAIIRVRTKTWVFPDGAALTAMIMAMVLRPQEPWWVAAATAIIAVVSKYAVRSRTANVFNPAALAIVISYYAFHTGQSWWGSLSETPLFVQPALLLGGIFIANRVKKMPLAIAFLGVYFVLFTIVAYVGNAQRVAEIFRSPDAQAALYFAFIILTDPPTSPAKTPDQIACGAIVAVTGFALFQWAGVVYYLLGGVLVGNVWEAWRRMSRRVRSSRSKHQSRNPSATQAILSGRMT